jgi:hypothetical protein
LSHSVFPEYFIAFHYHSFVLNTEICVSYNEHISWRLCMLCIMSLMKSAILYCPWWSQVSCLAISLCIHP